MQKSLLLFLLINALLMSSFAQVRVTQLLCENRTNPIGLDEKAPRFSWQLSSDRRNMMQTAYEIRVSDDASFRKELWNSGKTMSSQSVHVAYAGTPLQSDHKYYWQVRVWDNSGKTSAWSDPAYWQTALLLPGDWKAKWIEPGFTEDSI
ncbi:MAG: alpha-L-rhamnosidase, partial [Flavisolibacter sp.]|nr:alpha-L-rhamnosidase [Flavisolibacter sp.]